MRRRQNIFGRNVGCCGFCLISTAVLLVLSIISCAAVLVIIEDSAPKPLMPNFTPDQAQADALEVQLDTLASQAASTQRFSFTTDEQTLSSWLNLNAAAYTDAAIPVENIQVQFRDGRMLLYGEVDAAGLQNVPMLLEVGITFENGKLAINVSDANVGGFGAPDFVVNEMRDQVQRSLDEQLRHISEDYFVEGVFIQEGVFSVQGRAQP